MFKVSRLANTARSVVRDLDTGLFTSQQETSLSCFVKIWSILKMHCNASLIQKIFAWGWIEQACPDPTNHLRFLRVESIKHEVPFSWWQLWWAWNLEPYLETINQQFKYIHIYIVYKFNYTYKQMLVAPESSFVIMVLQSRTEWTRKKSGQNWMFHIWIKWKWPDKYSNASC